MFAHFEISKTVAHIQGVYDFWMLSAYLQKYFYTLFKYVLQVHYFLVLPTFQTLQLNNKK